MYVEFSVYDAGKFKQTRGGSFVSFVYETVEQNRQA